MHGSNPSTERDGLSGIGWSTFAHRFGRYYADHEMWIPPRLRTREWMFMPFGGGTPVRHRAFNRPESLRAFIRDRVPHSCFYSTAYYDEPSQTKMADKRWRGADLIFDLDGDHLPGVTDRDFPAMMDVIQHQAWSLWNDFLEPEFGFDPRHLQVTFSGHRGFHLHVRDPELLHLDSDARRELVSHIRGEAVDVDVLMPRIDGPRTTGWAPRLRSGLTSVLSALDRIDAGDAKELKLRIDALDDLRERDQARSRGSREGVRQLAALLQDERRRERIMQGHLSSLPIKRMDHRYYQNLLMDLVRADRSVVLGNAGETDEVVTIDVRRVIRWPTSLHGKSGLRVTEFPLERLDPDGGNPFDALDEAVVFGRDRSHRIRGLVNDARARIGDHEIELSTGEEHDVSEAMSMFLALKGWAKPLGSTSAHDGER